MNLTEGAELMMKPNSYNDGWVISTADGKLIGALSKKANSDLGNKGFSASEFNFHPREVTVKSIYRHLNIDEVNGEITEDWFVIIPQIRVCR